MASLAEIETAIMAISKAAGLVENHPIEKKPRHYPASNMILTFADEEDYSTEEVEVTYRWRLTWLWDMTKPDQAQEEYKRMLPGLQKAFRDNPTLGNTVELSELSDGGEPNPPIGSGVWIKPMFLTARSVRLVEEEGV